MGDDAGRTIMAPDGTRYRVRAGECALSFERADGGWGAAVSVARGTRLEDLSERELRRLLDRVTRPAG